MDAKIVATLIAHLVQDVQETVMVLVRDALDAEVLAHLAVRDVVLVATELVKINAEQAIALQHVEPTAQHHVGQIVVKTPVAVDVMLIAQQIVNQVAPVDVVRLADLIAREPQHNK